MILGLEAWIFWLALMIVFLIVEALTFNLITIWFAVGSLAALILSILGPGPAAQLAVMLALSTLLLVMFVLVLRPRYGPGNRTIKPTNVDRFIGAEGLVTETIDPVAGTGLIKALGQVWSATSEVNDLIEAGTRIIIAEIRGVKAVVHPRENK